MMTCQNVSENGSQLLDGEVTGLARISLQLHLFLCLHCRRYIRQLGLASKTAGQLEHNWQQAQPAERDEDIEVLIQKLKDL